MAETFTPVWNTPSQKLASVTEGQAITLPLSVDEYLYTQGVMGQTKIVVGMDYASRTHAVRVGNVPVSFAVVADEIRFTALDRNASIEVWLNNGLRFSLLNGKLPPGLSIHPDTGTISGMVGNILSTSYSTYTFTIRAASGAKVRDRKFSIDARGRDYAAFFNLASFPPSQPDPDVNLLTYYPLGVLDRGDAFNFTLDIIDPDGELPPIKIEPLTSLPLETKIYGGLPPGVKVIGNTIQGVITHEAREGRYVFKVRIEDPITPSSVNCMIQVTNMTDIEAQIVGQLEWKTPEGTVATIAVGDGSYLWLEATSAGDTPPTYTLAPNSGPLPPGLNLNASTGQITGSVGFHAQNKVYTFTVRAKANYVFVDRTFNIKVQSLFSSQRVYNLNLRMRVLERRDFARNYKKIISSEFLFRPEDANFGFDLSGTIYLLHGLNGTVDLDRAIEEGGSTLANEDFHEPFNLILGAHRSAVARDGEGRVVYEVIYRELHDRQQGAGGFQYGNNVVTRESVLWPQSAGYNAQYVYPVSLRNIRYDLIRDIGFQTDDPSKAYLVGPGSPEALPLWMRSEQVLGNPSTVIGFTAALVIAYVQPGMSERVLRIIRNNASILTRNGRQYLFDKYYASEGMLVSTTIFDENNEDTSFSDGTVFDGIETSVIKYI